MPEKFSYPSPEKEKPLEEKKEEVEDLFLRLNLEKARELTEKRSLEKPPENIHSAIDISNILKDGMSWEEILPIIRAGGFEGVNIGTDQVKNAEQAEQVKSKLEESQLDVVSFHGSLDPYFIGMTEGSNSDLIRHDFEVADILDPSQTAPINYDTIIADLPEISEFQRGRSLKEIHRIQREKLREKGIESEKDIIEQVIKYVAENRPKDSRRPVVFEIYQSFIAESVSATEENLKHLVECARRDIGDDNLWGITVDAGHLFNHLIMNLRIEGARSVKAKINEIFDTLEKYKDHIKMVHCAGTVAANLFQASKALAERAEMDPEAIRAWGMHQVIDNGIIIEMVKRLRKIKKGKPLVEASEIRPIHSATKYFGSTLHFDKEQSFAANKEQLRLQAEILGYTKEE